MPSERIQTAGGEWLTISPHYSELKDGGILKEAMRDFSEDSPRIYRRFARFPHMWRGRLLNVGAVLSVVGLASLAYYGSTHGSEDGNGQVDTSSKVNAREVLSDPSKLRALGICSLELQKQADYTKYLETIGALPAYDIKAEEYDAAAHLAEASNVPCQSQIMQAPGLDVSAGVVQFDVGLACMNAAYYKNATPNVENQKMYALNCELAAATDQNC